MSKTLSIKKSPSKEATQDKRHPVRGRNRNNHQAAAPAKPAEQRVMDKDSKPRPARGAPPRGESRDKPAWRDSGGSKKDARTPSRPFGDKPRDTAYSNDERKPRAKPDAARNESTSKPYAPRPPHKPFAEATSRAPLRHGKVRDGVREVVEGHVDRRAALNHKATQTNKVTPSKTNPADGIRISKYLADKGLCSRREADHYIEKGWVTVDGKRAQLGQRVLPTERVQLARQASAQQAQRVTIIINKPMGYVSGQAEDGYEPAVSLIHADTQWVDAPFVQDFDVKHLRGLAPAGRLDIDSVGLLVLTQDGRVAKQLIGDESQTDKEYLVRVEGELIDNGLTLLNHGLELDGVPLREAQVSWQNEDQLRFVLREGKKRQIRRMCELVGLKVVGLKRVRIGRVLLGNLPTGQWRYLSPDEYF